MNNTNPRFRFRVWDIEAQKMQYPIQIWNAMGCGEALNPIDATYEGECNIETCPPNPKSFENYHIMQCTGLKDKNGKLIYEEDIIEIEDFKEEKHIVKVYFDKKDAWFKHTYDSSGYDWSDLDFGVSSLWENVEIIGNIYENPKLLK